VGEGGGVREEEEEEEEKKSCFGWLGVGEAAGEERR
jgi:hypothetical protein